MLEVKKYSDLPGINTYDLKLIPDERGLFSEALRSDWKGFQGENPPDDLGCRMFGLQDLTPLV